MLIGHQKQWEFLKKSAESGKISHAYLFAGQEKLGKKTLALEWISFLFGGELRLNQHPDLALIEPEGKEIQIAQIRNLISRLSLKPHSAPFKAGIIDQAHLMNQESQTAFLKTLEEPRGKTVLILITEHPEMLFQTILSRVQKIKFYPVEKNELKDYLINRGASENQAEEIAFLSLGKPGMAVEFISNSSKIKFFQDKIKELNRISGSDLSLRFQYAKSLSENQQDLKETLDIWLRHFRDILILTIRNQQTDEAAASLTTRARQSRAKGEDEAAASLTTRAIAEAMKTSFSSLPSPRKRGSVGEDEAAASLTTRARQSRAKGEDEAAASLTKLKNILNLIQNINFLISTTNVNPRLALEILMLELGHNFNKEKKIFSSS